jgi:hypothetical protein
MNLSVQGLWTLVLHHHIHLVDLLLKIVRSSSFSFTFLLFRNCLFTFRCFCAAKPSSLRARRAGLSSEAGSAAMLNAVQGISDSFGVHFSSLSLVYSCPGSDISYHQQLFGTPSDSACPIANLSLTVRQLRCLAVADSQPLPRSALVAISSVQGRIIGETSKTFTTDYELSQVRSSFDLFLKSELQLVPYLIPPREAPHRTTCGVSFLSVLSAFMKAFPHHSWGDCSSTISNAAASTIYVVLQGDGAEQSSTHTVVQISFRLLDLSHSCMSPHVLLPLVLFDGGDTHENIYYYTQNLRAELHARTSQFTVPHPISHCPLHALFHLGGDQKFMRAWFDLPGGKGCPFCDIDPTELASAVAAAEADVRVSNTSTPILDDDILPLEVSRVIPDDLHLNLRASDRQFDLDLERSGALELRATAARAVIASVIHELGFANFEFFLPSSTSQAYSYRGITSDNKYHILCSLTKDQLCRFFNSSPNAARFNEERLNRIWNINCLLVKALEIAGTWHPSEEKVAEFHQTKESYRVEFLKEWSGNDFCNYLHILTDHIHQVLEQHHNLLCFSCHALERNNFMWTILFHDATNHKGDTAGTDTVLQTMLQHRLRILFNPESHILSPHTCPIERHGTETVAGLRKHIQSVHKDIAEQLLAQIDQEQKADDEEEKSLS